MLILTQTLFIMLLTWFVLPFYLNLFFPSCFLMAHPSLNLMTSISSFSSDNLLATLHDSPQHWLHFFITVPVAAHLISTFTKLPTMPALNGFREQKPLLGNWYAPRTLCQAGLLIQKATEQILLHILLRHSFWTLCGCQQLFKFTRIDHMVLHQQHPLLELN